MQQPLANARGANDVLACPADCPQPGKLAHAGGPGHGRHEFSDALANLLQAPGGRGKVAFILYLFSGGAEQHAAENDGRDQDAFRDAIRNGQDDLRNAVILFDDDKLAFARRKCERIVSGQPRYLVGPQASLVYDQRGSKDQAATCMNGDMALFYAHANHRFARKDPRSVENGAFAVGAGCPEWVDDALAYCESAVLNGA